MKTVGSMDIQLVHKQTQTLSPRLQHAVRLLQMSSLDFAAMVRDNVGKNPFLEIDDVDGEGADTHGADGIEVAHEPVLAAGSDDRDVWQAEIGSQLRRAGDDELSAMEMMAVETSLATHLHNQLNAMPLAPRTLHLARAIVESLDDDGYLRIPLEELAAIPAIDPPGTPGEMEEALAVVQSLEPDGVGARSVAECLLLQLPAIEDAEVRSLARTIVTHHLQRMAARDVAGLAHALGESPQRVEAVCDRIRRLDPRPGWRVGSSQVNYVVPDVLVKRVRGQWTVQLNPAVVPPVRLNRLYAELFMRHRSPQDREMAGHLQDARWTLRNVEQRFSTILDVATAIVKRQRHFLEFGSMAMKPLGLKEIADEVGIHESTVSRVTNNKYMATPLGVFELKYFFSRAMVSTNGKACSGIAIRGLIQDIIDAEHPANPVSDAEITRQLAQQGLVIARRTVTKYRQMLHIESVERRRRHA
jgi:RNA polymerase sigma-54 factor